MFGKVVPLLILAALGYGGFQFFKTGSFSKLPFNFGKSQESEDSGVKAPLNLPVFSKIEDIQPNDIVEYTTRGNEVTVLKFYSDDSAACKTLSSVLENITQKKIPGARFVTINVEKYPAIGQLYDVTTLPETRFFVEGTMTASFVGVRDEVFITTLIQNGLDRLASNTQTTLNPAQSESKSESKAAPGVSPTIQRIKGRQTLPSGIAPMPAS